VGLISVSPVSPRVQGDSLTGMSHGSPSMEISISLQCGHTDGGGGDGRMALKLGAVVPGPWSFASPK